MHSEAGGYYLRKIENWYVAIRKFGWPEKPSARGTWIAVHSQSFVFLFHLTRMNDVMYMLQKLKSRGFVFL